MQPFQFGSGCGSVTVLVEEGKIDTANPGLDPRDMKCHWLIEGPAEYVVKLQLEDFAVEFSLGCICDAVTIYCEEEANQLWTERNLSNCHGQLMVCEGFGLTKELLGNRQLL
ncbi:LOW QUALITY PROTEIN: ovochymase-1 [Ammospiza maritima maritima]